MKRVARMMFAAAMLLLTATAAAAEPNVEAGRIHFNRGVSLYRAAEFPAAASEFRRAYEAAPSYRILFNLGQALAEIKDYAGALDAFERYLADGGTAAPADLRAIASEQIEKLRSHVGQVEIRANVPGAQVTVDGVSVGVTPLEKPLRVSAGWRKISAKSHGRVPAEQGIEIGGGDTVTVELELAEPTAAPPPVTRREPKSTSARRVTRKPAAPAPEDTGPRNRVVISAAVTGTLVVATAITGILALRSKSDYDGKANTFGTSSSELTDQRDRTRDLAIATDVLGGLSVAAGAVTFYFAVSNGDSAKTHASAPAPRLSLGPGSVKFAGSF